MRLRTVKPAYNGTRIKLNMFWFDTGIQLFGKCKVKVQLSLYLTKYQAMKTNCVLN